MRSLEGIIENKISMEGSQGIQDAEEVLRMRLGIWTGAQVIEKESFHQIFVSRSHP